MCVCGGVCVCDSGGACCGGGGGQSAQVFLHLMISEQVDS